MTIPSGPAGTPAAGPAAGTGLDKPTVTIATYQDYASAQRAVDYLSDNKFPVEHTAIIGTNLSLVENVIGRMTTGKAALAGAASGVWFGLFIGLLFGIFAKTNWVAVVLTCVGIGAVWGAIFGAIAHAVTRGQRDFASTSSLQASEYGIAVDTTHAEQAKQLIAQLNLKS